MPPALARGDNLQHRRPGARDGILEFFEDLLHPGGIEVASDALQLLGGNGLTKEYPIEKIFRDARAALIEDGTNDVLSLVGANLVLARPS